jgi:hypothetical protein
MNTNELSAVLKTWLGITQHHIDTSFEMLKTSKALPLSKKQNLNSLHIANCLLSTMLVSLRSEEGARLFQDILSMSLEGEPGVDPLDVSSTEIFSKFVDKTLGFNSINGYLNFSETLGVALERSRINIGQIEIREIRLEVYGHDIAGIIAVMSHNKNHEFHFTIKGRQIIREGLMRSVVISRDILLGLGMSLAADMAKINSVI